MIRIFSVLGITVLFFMATACATSPSHNLESLNVGMDKDDVLRLSGSPWITRRLNSQDLWIYRYYKGDQQYRKELRFEDGRLIALSPARPHPSPEEKLLDSDNMDQFKKAAESKNEAYEEGFKDVTPSNDDE